MVGVSAFEAFMGWNYYVGALVGFFIVLLYILFGGFIAVAWSDVFQGALMFLGLVLLPIIGYFFLSEGIGLWEKLGQLDPGLLNPWGQGGLNGINIATLLGYAFIGLGFMGSPQLFVRFISVKSENEIKKGRWIAILFTLITDSAAVMIGIFARYFFTEMGTDVEAVLGTNAQNSIIILVEYLLPTIFMGLFIAVVLAAIMSTIDSLLIVASSAIVRDIYQQIFNPKLTLESLTRLSRIATLAMSILALALAMAVAFSTPERTIFWFVIFGWSGIAASFCPTIILSLFWSGFNEKGAIAAMVSGFLAVPVFKFVLPSFEIIGPYFDKMDVMGPSFAVGFLAGYVGSKIWPDVRSLSPEEIGIGEPVI